MSMLAEKRRKTKYVLTPLAKPLWKCESSGMQMGKRLMEKMGWSAGKGLGASEQGIAEPLKTGFKADTKGMGYKAHGNPFENLDQFNALLSSLTGTESPATDEAHSFVKLEEKSEKSRSRVHYKKFTRGKDLSKASHVDISCIVGNGKKEEEPEEEVEEDRTGENDHSHGVTTINSGSLADYFRNKMEKRMLKQATEGSSKICDSLEREEKSDEYYEEEMKVDIGVPEEDALEEWKNSKNFIIEPEMNSSHEVEICLGASEKEDTKNKKKKKRSRDENEDSSQYGENGGCSLEPNLVVEEEPRKKKKKKKDKHPEENEVMQIDDEGPMHTNSNEESSEVGDDSERLRKKSKKKKRDKERIEIDSSEIPSEILTDRAFEGLGKTETNEALEKISESPKKKKKKNVFESEDAHLEDERITTKENPEITSKKCKKKKSKNKDCETPDTDADAPEEVTEIEQPNVEKSPKKSKKRKNKNKQDESHVGRKTEDVNEAVDGIPLENQPHRKTKKRKEKAKEELEVPGDAETVEEQNKSSSVGSKKKTSIDVKSIVEKFVGSNLETLPGYAMRRNTQGSIEAS